jgi:hypothetical protein
VVAHAFNLSTWETEEANLCKFKANLAYRASSSSEQPRLHRETLSQKKKKKEKKRGVCGIYSNQMQLPSPPESPFACPGGY